MEEIPKVAEKKASMDRNLVSTLSLIAALAIGFIGGKMICGNQPTDYDKGQPTTPVIEGTGTTSVTDATEKAAEISYKTFSDPDVYFTFEYPSAWVYEKHDPETEYDETYYTFYANADEKRIALSLNYPMYETAMDTCLKFEEVTDYRHEHIATADPGTFINYMTCGATKYDQAESFWGEHSMGDIFWQKGIWDGDKGITSDIATQARIHWDDNKDIVTEEISGHIAHSIKIIK